MSGESEVSTDAGPVRLFDEKDEKEDLKVDEPRAVENDSNVDNEDEREDGHEDRRDEKGFDAVSHVSQNEVRFNFFIFFYFYNDHPAVQVKLNLIKIIKK